MSTYDNHLTIPYAMEAKREGITMMAIGVGQDVDIDELMGIASHPSLVHLPGSYAAVMFIEDFLLSTVCDIPVRKW